MTLRANESCTATSSGGRRANGAAVVDPRARRLPACTWPNAPKRTFVTERFIAFAISSVSRVPEAPTSMPGDDQDVLVEHEAGRRRGEPGERVQQRDHDRHVGAADRQHEHHAEHEREQRSAPKISPLRPRRPATIADPERDGAAR